MRLLILGGTRFLGRHLVLAAQERGHEITLFNRGQSNPGLFPGVVELVGDRDGNLEALHGRRWDAVIDTSGYVPRIVRQSAELLAPAVNHYTFISSISVYGDLTAPNIDESWPVATIEDEATEEITGESYGALKALCEQVVLELFPQNGLVIRPGLIVGPHDTTDRFTYWPVRVDRGGEVLAPAPPEYGTQFIDVRDLAEWTILMVEQKAAGVYNATGPNEPMPLGALLDICRAVSGSDARFTWVSPAFLLEHGVQPWVELPLWIPDEAGSADISRAVAAGLAFRPVAATVADTLSWADGRPADHRWRAGLDAEKEARLLEMWHSNRILEAS
jgi:2'-hydroxyisoflavone reductase